MSVSNGIISAPVSISDIQNAIGTSGGGDLATLCRSGNINKWAKYKPVRTPVIDTVTGQWNASTGRWLSSATWWKADGKCGLNIDTFNSPGSMTNPSSFLYKLKNGLLPWEYLLPHGGSQSPYRQQDFARYWHDAVPAVGECSVKDGDIVWVHRTGQATTLQIDYDAPADDDLNLTLKDFTIGSTPLPQCYLGMLLWRDNGNYLLVTTNQPMGTGNSVSIEVEIGYSDTGNWSMVPFICSSRIQQGGSIPEATYLSASITTPIHFIAKPDGQTIEYFVSAAWNIANNQISAFTKVINNLTSAQNVQNVTIYIYSTTSPTAHPSTGSLVTSRVIGSCTVAAEDDFDFSEETFSVSRNMSLTYWIGAAGNGGGVDNDSWMQIEDADAPLD